MSLNFFDCNCSIGRLAVPQPGSIFTTSDLIKEMDYLGIDQALAYHTLAREYSPAVGNARLMEELAGCERITPCWAVMPNHTGEFLSPDKLISQMIQQGVKAARIFPHPTWHNWMLSDWSTKPLFTALSDRHIPLFVSFDQLSWNDVYSLGKSYPDLPLIVTEVRYEESRNFYPLLDEIQNLNIDLSWTIVHLGLEAAVERFGPSRFLFGSRMPIFSAGPAISYLTYAEISAEAREMISSKNLLRLLSWHATAGLED